LKPRQKRELARWAKEAYSISERRATKLLEIQRATYRYRSHCDPQTELRMRLRDLAATYVRYGYRRLTVLLRREGWDVNNKRIYRLYKEAGLFVRSKVRRKIERRQREPKPMATKPNQCWSMDFVSVRLSDGRFARILTIVDQFTRECVGLFAAVRMSGNMVARDLDIAFAEREAQPLSITVDNGSEFTSRAMSEWAIERGVRLDFIQPGKPVENAYIESFNGRLRDECLNVVGFRTVEDLTARLAEFRHHYNGSRPHSSLNDDTPEEFAARHQPQCVSRFALADEKSASKTARQGPAVNGLPAALDKPPRMRKCDLYEGEAPATKSSGARDALKRLWRQFQARTSGLRSNLP
jgi:putative transposase